MLIKYETFFWENGIKYIAGVDEVGRGALAGPLVSAAVILNREHLLGNNDVSSEILENYELVKDSKLLTARRREKLTQFIKNNAISFSITEVSNKEVDDMGISAATQKTFFDSITNLEVKPEHIFTDTFEIKKIVKTGQTNITKGDNISITIAAASIIAKVYRDNIMVQQHEKFSEYGFDKHKGYGTKYHIEALKKHGPCLIHRKSFSPVKKAIDSQ